MFDRIKKLLGLKETIRCSKCNRLNDDDDIYCIYCGNKLPTPKKIRSDTTTKKCPKCGNHNPYDSIYCEECGTKLVKTTTDTIKTQTPKYEKTITCPNCKKTFRKDTFTYEKYNRCPHCQYNFKQTQIDGKFKIQIPSLYEYYQKHGTTTAQLLNEIQEINRVYERIDKLGGTNYIKQQLKTKSTYKIAQEHNITPENLKQYCQKHGTSINQLTKEIDRDNAKEQERQRLEKEKQQEQERQRLEKEKQQEQERQHKINQQILEINRVYERIDKLGGTNYIKQQLKTKSTYKIAQEHNITPENLKQYCQKHGTSINQLRKEIDRDNAKERERQRLEKEKQQEQERQHKINQQILEINRVCERIDKLGGTNYIKQQLKTNNAEEIAQRHNIHPSYLNKYCQKHSTTIIQLLNEIQEEAYEKIDKLGGTNYIKQQLKTNNREEIAKKFNISITSLHVYCQKHSTTIIQLLNEIQEEAYEKIDKLGGTNYIKQQLKTNNREEIAKKFNISITSLHVYCQKHSTTIIQLLNEIQEEETYEKIDKLGGTNYIKQQLKTNNREEIAKKFNISITSLHVYCQKHSTTIEQLLNEIQEEETYEKIDKLGGTNYIKQQLKTNNVEEIAKKFNLSRANLNKYCRKHNTTIEQLLNEIQEEAYEKIDNLGGTLFIKQQLKTKSAEEIAQRHNIHPSYLNKYCQKHSTTIIQLLNEIQEEAYEKIDNLGGTHFIKQQLKTKSAEEIAQRHNIHPSYLNKYCQKHSTTIIQLLNEIQEEAYEKIDNLGGTHFIKQQLKTKSAEEIAQRHNIHPSYLNKYCQKHSTTIIQLLNEIQEEAYEKIDNLGGTHFIKQQLKTKSYYKIEQEHNITRTSLQKYCRKHGTSIKQLRKEIDRDNAKERERQRRRKQQQEQERQDRYMKNLKNEKRMRDY